MQHSLIHTLPSPEATEDLARALAHGLEPGDVILLDGPIGAGKSHFTRAAIHSLLLQQEDIPSPTFTLVQVYDGTSGEIWHSDLYRLTSPAQCDELGLWEAFETAICFVEWPDRLGEYQPANALHLTLSAPDPEAAPDLRHAQFSWTDPRWTDVLAKVIPA